VPLPLKKNELIGSEHIGIFKADAVVRIANTISHPVELL
jgi:hypothetical protein